MKGRRFLAMLCAIMIFIMNFSGITTLGAFAEEPQAEAVATDHAAAEAEAKAKAEAEAKAKAEAEAKAQAEAEAKAKAEAEAKAQAEAEAKAQAEAEAKAKAEAEAKAKEEAEAKAQAEAEAKAKAEAEAKAQAEAEAKAKAEAEAKAQAEAEAKAKEEAPKEEPAKEEPAKEEAPKEEPAKEEAPKEEPAKEEPAKEEAPKEEPAKEEPAKEETKVEEEPQKETEVGKEETPDVPGDATPTETQAPATEEGEPEAGDNTPEPTEEPTVEPTEEPTPEPTLEPVVLTDLAADANDVFPGQTIHFTFKTTGAERVDYRIYNEAGEAASGEAADGAFEWTPQAAGAYSVEVVASAGEDVQTAELAVNVRPDYSAVVVTYSAFDTAETPCLIPDQRDVVLAKGDYNLAAEGPAKFEGYDYAGAWMGDVKLSHLRYSEEDRAWLVTAGDTTAPLTEDAALELRYDQQFTKRVYQYEDGNIKAVIRLRRASDVPDDADFVVRQVTPSTRGYNYDAYMDALNDQPIDQEYTPENTLLYDFAFMVDEIKPETGLPTGKVYEYQPESGSIKIEITFKKNQISENLGAEEAADVEVIHLPLDADVRDSVDSTAQATNISANDINIDERDATVNLNGSTDNVKVTLDSLSIIAIAVTAEQETADAVTVRFVDRYGVSIDGSLVTNDPVKYYLAAKVTSGETAYYAYQQIGNLAGTYEFNTYSDNHNSNRFMSAAYATLNGLTENTQVEIAIFKTNANQAPYSGYSDIASAFSGSASWVEKEKELQAGDSLDLYTIANQDAAANGTIVLTPPNSPRHAANVTLSDSLTADDIAHLYVLFRQLTSNNSKAISIKKVTGSGTVYSDYKFNDNGTKVDYDPNNSTEVLLVWVPSDDLSQPSHFNTDSFQNGIIAYSDGDLYLETTCMVQISDVDSQHTKVVVSQPTYTAELRLYEGWGIRTGSATFTDPVTITAQTAAETPVTLRASGVAGDGTISFTLPDGVTSLPALSLEGWTLNGEAITTSTTIDDYKFSLPRREGSTYILEAHRDDFIGVRIDYYDAWGSEPLTEGVRVDGGRMTLSKNDSTVTGSIATDGTVTITIPGDKWETAADYQWDGDHAAIAPYILENKENKPTKDMGAHLLVFKARKAKTYGAVINFQAANGDTSQTAALGKSYVLKATSVPDNGGQTTPYYADVSENGAVTWRENNTPDSRIASFAFYDAADTEFTTPLNWLGDYELDAGSLSTDALSDDDLFPDAGVYQLKAKAPKLYPAKLVYATEPESVPVTENYYILAKRDGEAMAYVPLVGETGALAFTDGTNAVQIPKDYEYSLVKLTDAATGLASFTGEGVTEVFGFDSYDLSLPPTLKDEDGAETLVFKATKILNGSKIYISTYDYNGSTLITPETPFGSDYFLRVAVRYKTTHEQVGWALQKINWADGNTTTIEITGFAPMGNHAAGIDSNDANWQAFNSSQHYIEVDTEGSGVYPARVIRANGTNDLTQMDWSNATDPARVNDLPPEGYAYIKGEKTEDGYRIKLKKATKKNYYVRLKFDTTDADKIKLAGGLYVKVTVGHQSSGTTTYGFVRVDDAFKDATHMKVVGDYTYIDVPIESWLKEDGSDADPADNKYTGNESSIKVELVGVPAASIGSATPNGNGYQVLAVGQYVNSAKLVAYPTFTNNVDHFEVNRPEQNGVDPHITDVYDVVSLSLPTDHFGGYSLEYILNGYNIVTLCPNTPGTTFGDGDFEMKNHCMGGVLIRGDIIYVTGSGVADSEFITKPSVIGGYVPAREGAFFNNRENNNHSWNGYVGALNTVIGDVVNGKLAGGRGYTGTLGETVATDDYIDWVRLQSMVKSTSSSLAATADASCVTKKGTAKYEVTAGANAIISDYPENTVVTINIIAKDIYNQPIYDPNVVAATIVTIPGGGSYKPPKVTLNGQSLSTVEDGSGMSLLWNFPNAEEVKVSSDVTPFFGHVVAPAAYIEVGDGNYSGCMVGNKVSSLGEGHLYPYNQGTLIGIYGEFDFGKTVNGGEPTEKQQYSFTMEELRDSVEKDNPTASDFWQTLQTIKNVKGTVAFKEVSFTTAGDHWFKVYEKNSSNSSDLDDNKYLVKVTTTAVTDKGKTTITVTGTTIYRITNEETLLTIDQQAKTATVNQGSITKVSDLTWGNDNVVDTGVTFANTYQANGTAILQVGKHLEGATLTNGQFTFTLSALEYEAGKLSPMKNADGVAYRPADLTVGNAGDNALVSFPTLYYQLDDAGKVYKYKIVEDDFDIEGVTRDISTGPEVIYVKVTVPAADGVTSQLGRSTVEYFSDADCTVPLASPVFVNKYEETQDGKISVRKVVKVNGETDGDAIGQTITVGLFEKDDDEQPIKIGEIDFGAGEPLCTFSGLTVGTTYYVYEVTGNATDGYTKVTNGHQITVGSHAYTVLQASAAAVAVKNASEDDEILITNARATVTLRATKTVDGDPATGNAFTFNVYELDQSTGNWSTSPIATKQNSGGTITFDPISLSAPGTYYFMIEEDQTAVPGYELDSTQYIAKVEVSDELVVTGPTYSKVKNSAGLIIEDTANTNNYIPDSDKLEPIDTAPVFANKTVQKKSISATKVWDDNNNQDGKRAQVTLHLNKKVGENGSVEQMATTYDKTIAADATELTVTWENLPKYENGVEIFYSVTEDSVSGYTTEITGTEAGGYTVTNSHETGKKSISATKVWDDNNNQDGKRAQVTLHLNKKVGENGSVEQMATTYDKTIAADATELTVTWENLPKYENGVEIFYSVTEDSVSDYTTAITGTEADGYTVTNTLDRGTLSITKAVSGGGSAASGKTFYFTVKNAAGKYITAAGAESTSEVKLSIQGGKTVTISKLPVGTYTVTELGTAEGGDAWIDGYSLVATGDGDAKVIKDGEAKITLTNTYITDEQTVLTGTKTIAGREFKPGDKWTFTVTADPATAPMPETTSITIEPTAGTSVDLNFGTITYTLADLKGANSANFVYTVVETGSVKYVQNDNGQKTFRVKLEKQSDGSVKVTTNASENLVSFTNRYDSGSLAVKKVVEPAAAAKDTEFTFTVTLDDKTISGKYGDMTFTNGVATVKVKHGETKTATGLPNAIGYTVKETQIPKDYEFVRASDDNGTIAKDQTKTATFTNRYVYTVLVKKVDVTTEEELEGAHIQILDKDGKVVDEWDSTKKPHESKELKPGETYTLRETVAPEGYTVTTDTTFTVNEDGTVTTKGHTTKDEEGNEVLLVEDAKTSIKVKKVDIDGGKELEGAKIQIKDKNGKVVAEWTSGKEEHEVTGLKTGETYTLHEEVAPEGYTIATDTTFTIDKTGKVTTTGKKTTDGILLVEDKITSIKVSKVDVTTQKELEGAHIQIIDKNGKVVREWDSKKTPEVITGLKTGETYTLRETVAPEGYDITTDTKFSINEDGTVKRITGNINKDGVILVEDSKKTTPTTTPTSTPTTPNTTPKPTTSVTGNKVWLDENNAYSTRPKDITVHLYANGELVNATPTWEDKNTNNWRFTFSNLPSVTDTGATIRYTVEEEPVAYYETTINGTTITNTLVPRGEQKYTQLSGTKTWEDNDNAAGKRPTSITVRLYCNGKELAQKTVTADDNWQYDFGKLPTDNGYGKQYVYEVREDAVPGYFSRSEGLNLINKLLDFERPDMPTGDDSDDNGLTPTGNIPGRHTDTPRPRFEDLTEEEFEELVELLDYGTPLWGMLGTGDETPAYPFVFAGIGVAILALLLLKRKKRMSA